MSKKRLTLFSAIVILVFILYACTSPQSQQTEKSLETAARPTEVPFTSTPRPTRTATPLPSPTSTATPLPVTLQGTLFFDIDGSGSRNNIEMKYYDGLIHPKNPRFRQNPDLVKVLERYILFHPLTKDGTTITIMEPGLSGFQVCATLKKTVSMCAVSDAEGNFSMANESIRLGDAVGLTISDAREEKVGTMSYQNRYVKSVTIPAYEMHGVKVPEQHLVQTNLMKLSNTFNVTADNEPMLIGLMQGFLPYPPLKGSPYIYSFFDHDPRIGYGLDWRGRTGLTPKTYNHPPNKMTDNLDGVDIGGQKGDFVLSMGFGMAAAKKSETMGNQVVVMIDNIPQSVTYSHLDTILITELQEVFNGQIIGTNGRTGKDVGAPHVHLDVGNTGVDPFGDPNGTYAQVWSRAFSPAEFP